MDQTRVSLLQRATDPNDHASWAELVRLYEPLLLAFLVRNKQMPEGDARDVIQDVFIKLIRQLRGFRYDPQKGRFRSWLWALAHGAMIDHHRRENRIRRSQDAWVPPPEGGEDEQWRKMHHERVLQFAMEKVRAETAEKTWHCFEQHLIKGRKGAEVGQELNLPANTVYVNSRRVLERVRQCAADLREDLGDDQP